MAQDLPAALSFLDANSIEVDRPQQQREFRSAAPWVACRGFSFSVVNGPRITFDEMFEGWGPEDRELILRLVRDAGYSVAYRDDIVVYHLEACSTGRTPYSYVMDDSTLIGAYLRNILYFVDKYPGENLISFCKPLLCYSLTSDGTSWVGQAAKAYDDSLVAKKLDEIRRWVTQFPRNPT